MYLADIEGKTTDANAKPVVLKESPATAWVDGNNGLGPVVGNFCMQLAIEKAKSVGVGWVAAKRTLADPTGQSRMMYCVMRDLRLSQPGCWKFRSARRFRMTVEHLSLVSSRLLTTV